MVKFATLFCLGLFLASPAWACGVLAKADPKVGSTVAPTDRIALSFTQAIDPRESTLHLTDMSGRAVKTSASALSNGAVLSVSTPTPLPPGDYTVNWNVLWLECMSATQGSYKFHVR